MIPKEKKIMDIYPSIFFKVPYHCLFRNQIKKERSNCLVKRYDGPILINPYMPWPVLELITRYISWVHVHNTF